MNKVYLKNEECLGIDTRGNAYIFREPDNLCGSRFTTIIVGSKVNPEYFKERVVVRLVDDGKIIVRDQR